MVKNYPTSLTTVGFFISIMSDEINELNKRIEKLDEAVFDHEDLLGTILSALLDEQALSEEARVLIKEAYDTMFNPKK